ncbi:ABC transporter permease [Siculibacillus lacustris]|uniref:ABC transporter permease n=1 Tax=Siculibacillus lacustris TaxID=1549641 RepID=A0A4Q9VTR1_9HYPH|nr:methionine ABC transporter permease [Siculibacillus lacustris]TBW39494.1 ABC transporter permease [Siculibacillus lacustris]
MPFDLLSPAVTAALVESLKQTAFMVSVAAVLSTLLGLPLGILLVVTAPGHIAERPAVNRVVGTVVNLVRSTPFIIMMVAIIPFTRLVVGTTVGTAAAIVPLTLAITPLFARLAETAMREVDRGVIEAAEAIGASPWEIVVKVLVPEALPGIVAGVTVALVSLIGYSTMAGTVGGGGLGDLGVRYGYQRFMPEVMVAVVVVLVVLVQAVQIVGDAVARAVNHRIARRRRGGV